MVLCTWQRELFKIFILLSIKNVSPWRGASRCFSVFEVRWLHSTDWSHERVRQNTCLQTCEETVNRDTQTSGGTKGFSLKPGAVSKYYLIAEYRSIFMRRFKEMLHLGTPATVQHTDLQASRIRRDEDDVKLMMLMIQGSWINLFKGGEQDLVCLFEVKLPSSHLEKESAEVPSSPFTS